MKTRKFFFFILAYFFLTSASFKTNFNATINGCSGNGCHASNEDLFKAIPQNNFKIKVHFNEMSPGDVIAAQLVDSRGRVVDFIEKSFENPLILTAPSHGSYTVLGGIKTEHLKCETEQITFDRSTHKIPDISYPLSKFELYRNHPNPFKKKTIIKFSLTRPDFVELDVFSGSGKFVRNITKQNYEAGIHQEVWDGLDQYHRPVPPGLYFYQIKSNRNRNSRARIMVLTR
jgi:hypothetical protein